MLARRVPPISKVNVEKQVKDPYNTLGVTKTSTDDEIKKAYRKLAKRHHPDSFSDADEKAKHVEIFKEVSEAYEILSDKDKRQEYDTYGHVGRGQPQSGKPFTHPMDDFMRNMFGGSRGRQRQQKGEDIILECHVTLEDVMKGGERDLTYQQSVLCESCSGVGGTEINCAACNGTGLRIIYGANMTVQTTCDKCGGAGKSITNTCTQCHDGIKGSVEKTVKFEIPLGGGSNMQFAFRGQGEPIPNGIPGDLFVILMVQDHNKFQRAGADLLYHANVRYSILVLGGEVDVPTMHGDVSLKIPAGTPVGKKFRLRGQGLPVFGRSKTFGDQLVEVGINIPTKLSSEHEELIKKLSEIERG